MRHQPFEVKLRLASIITIMVIFFAIVPASKIRVSIFKTPEGNKTHPLPDNELLFIIMTLCAGYAAYRGVYNLSKATRWLLYGTTKITVNALQLNRYKKMIQDAHTSRVAASSTELGFEQRATAIQALYEILNTDLKRSDGQAFLKSELRDFYREFDQFIKDNSCPISLSIMNDPVTVSSGHTYDRAFIEAHLRTYSTNPSSNTHLALETVIGAITRTPVTLASNLHIKNEIEKRLSQLERKLRELESEIRRVIPVATGTAAAASVALTVDEEAATAEAGASKMKHP